MIKSEWIGSGIDQSGIGKFTVDGRGHLNIPFNDFLHYHAVIKLLYKSRMDGRTEVKEDIRDRIQSLSDMLKVYVS